MLAVVSSSAVVRGVETAAKTPVQQSHASDDPSTAKNPGYLRPRVGNATATDSGTAGGTGGSTEYVELGPVPDDLTARLNEAMKLTGLIPDPKTGEKKPTDGQNLSKNQKRPDGTVPTPAPPLF